MAVRLTSLPHQEKTVRVLWEAVVSVLEAEQGVGISPKLWAQDMEADAPAAKMLKEQGQQAEAGVTPCAQRADENKAEPGPECDAAVFLGSNV